MTPTKHSWHHFGLSECFLCFLRVFSSTSDSAGTSFQSPAIGEPISWLCHDTIEQNVFDKKASFANPLTLPRKAWLRLYLWTEILVNKPAPHVVSLFLLANRKVWTIAAPQGVPKASFFFNTGFFKLYSNLMQTHNSQHTTNVLSHEKSNENQLSRAFPKSLLLFEHLENGFKNYTVLMPSLEFCTTGLEFQELNGEIFW